jgi:hypothetical protein
MVSKSLSFCVLFLLVVSCKAQVAPLYNLDPYLPEGTKHKDLDGDLNKFVGTWKWQSNDSVVIMQLQMKEDVFHDDNNKYEDYIIGEYKFTVNGQLVQNYLPNLSNVSSQNYNDFNYNIFGNRIFGNNENSIYCNGCGPEERIIRLYFGDPLYDYIPGAMYMRHLSLNGTEIIEAVFTQFTSYIEPHENAPDQNRVPFGEYVFIKQ